MAQQSDSASYACDELKLSDRNHCPDYGSSDCPYTLSDAICGVDKEYLLYIMSFWGKEKKR